MTTRLTYCRICEAACGLIAELGPDGRPTRLRPDPDHPSSRGFACKKGIRFLDVANHPDRLLHPQRRRAYGRLERVSWRDAIADVSSRLRAIRERHGNDSVALYYGNPTAFSALGTVAMFGFSRALGTRNVFSAASQDCNNKFAAAEILHGSPGIHPVPDLEHAELALFLGTNPAVSLSSFVHLPGGTRVLDDLVKRGGHVVWVDPRRTESARRWGEHLPIRPGTDAVLLLALLHCFRHVPRSDPRVEGLDRLLDFAAAWPPERAAAVTGIPAERIVALAERIRRARGTTIHLSVGVNMGGFGTLSAVLAQALAYVSGNLDSAGGLLFTRAAMSGARALQQLGVATRTAKTRIGGLPSMMDTLSAAVLADEILTPGDGQIRALIVLAGDPLVSIPGEARLREALRSLDLLVSIDLFENETGRLAHTLLPAASWLERWDAAVNTLPLQSGTLLQAARPVMPPPGEARTDGRILGDLLAGLRLAPVSRTISRLPLDRFLPSFGRGFPISPPKPGTYLGRGPVTPDNRVRFWHPALEAECARLASAAPPDGFLLVGRRLKLGHNSWLRGAGRDDALAPVAFLAAADLNALGLPDGGPIRVSSSSGSLVLEARAEEGLARGVVVVPHGHPTLNVNAVIPAGAAAAEPVSGQLHMTGVPVTVAAA